MKTAFCTIASCLILLALAGAPVEAQSRRMVKAMPKTLPTPIDFKAQLPALVRGIVDQHFSNWIFKTGLVEYQHDNAPLETCQINEDSVPDYALHILSWLKTDTVESFLALVSNHGSYSLFTLQSLTRRDVWFGAYFQEIFERGTEFDTAPFEEEGDNRTSFTTDCISISMSDKNSCSAYLFQHDAFKVFSPCE